MTMRSIWDRYRSLEERNPYLRMGLATLVLLVFLGLDINVKPEPDSEYVQEGVLGVILGLFQVLPGSVLYGATLLMFIMVGISGYQIVRTNNPGRRDWFVVCAAIASGLALSATGDTFSALPPSVINVIQFPVSSGAFVAMLLEVVVPRGNRDRLTHPQ